MATLGRTHESLADLRSAVEFARSTNDPALSLHRAALLAIEGDETLAGEAHAAVRRITVTLPDETMCCRFEDAEPVRLLRRLIR